MLDQNTRAAILRLREQEHGTRAIARVLGISRRAVCKVIANGNVAVPQVIRLELAEPYRDQILELHVACKGHMGRVHEELLKKGATLSYQALTAFCRRHGIGHDAPKPAGRYEFAGDATGAGTGCGSCRGELAELIARHEAKPVKLTAIG